MSEKYKNKEWLEEKYVKEGNSFKSVANMCSCSRETVRAWAEKFNLNNRDPHDTRDIINSDTERLN